MERSQNPTPKIPQYELDVNKLHILYGLRK